MCGITGIWHLDGSKVEEQKITRFNNSLSHRGPDGFGTSFHNNATLALGHRRLSILDLSEAGKQPMTYADGQLTITFNGEIFNFIQIRDELKKYGYAFRSDTDTEVILAAYHRWGKECLHRFNGMWAFAIWDEPKQELFLARDRFGIKPLYYHFLPNRLFAFASETLAFKNLADFSRTLNPDELDLSIADSTFLEGAGKTLFDGVESILPGHSAFLKPNDLLKVEQWWRIDDHIEISNHSLSESIEHIDALLRDSTKLRLISDVPVATALSGGLDSTTVFGYVNRLRSEESLIQRDSLAAYTVSFEGLESDELDYAKEAAEFYHQKLNVVKHHQADVAEQILASQKILDAYSPSPILAISEIYKAMKNDGRSVSMDGHGVDEMLFGYRSMVDRIFYNAIQNGDRDLAAKIGAVKAQMVHPKLREKFSLRIAEQVDSMNVGVWSRLKKFIKPSNNAKISKAYAGSTLIFNPSNHSEDLNIALLEFTRTTLPTVLRNFDRAGMMHGVEIRMPFMDYRLVKYIMGIGIESKLNEGFTKFVLRQSQIGKIPESLRTRTYKVGVGNPLSLWMNQENNNWVYDMCSANAKAKYEVKVKSRSLTDKECLDLWIDINKHSILI